MTVLNDADLIAVGAAHAAKVYLGGTEVWAAPWLPVNESSLIAWIDAADAASIIAAAGKVSQWNDKSGHGHHLQQATATAQPTTGIRTVAGHNAIDFVSAKSMVALFTGPASFMVFAVVERDAGGLGTAFWVTGAGNNLQMHIPESYAGAYAGGRDRDTNSMVLYFFADHHIPSTGLHVLGGMYADAPTNKAWAWIDGADGPQQNVATWTSLPNGLQVGDLTGDVFDGAICEVAMFNTYDPAIAQHFHTYAQTKWGAP